MDEPPWAHAVRSIVARHARVDGVARTQHLDLDLGLESLDRIEIHTEVAEALRLNLPQQAAAEVQTVGELLDLIGTYIDGPAPVDGAAVDRWADVLAGTPPKVEPYLRRQAFWEAVAVPYVSDCSVVPVVVGLRSSRARPPARGLSVHPGS